MSHSASLRLNKKIQRNQANAFPNQVQILCAILASLNQISLGRQSQTGLTLQGISIPFEGTLYVMILYQQSQRLCGWGNILWNECSFTLSLFQFFQLLKKTFFHFLLVVSFDYSENKKIIEKFSTKKIVFCVFVILKVLSCITWISISLLT